MAGDWIKMRLDLHDDPAVFRLAGMLKIDRFSVVGRLHAFWSWADKHAVDGRVDGATTQLVDEVVSLPGFADALMVVCWLSLDDRGLSIPNYERHNGKSAKQRALKNQRQGRWRSGGATVDGDVDATTPTREEKRREEKQPLPPGFARFWLAWPNSPRKVAKSDCAKRWARHALEADADRIVAHVMAMKQSRQWLDGFEPAPATYLNQRRWEDDIPAGAGVRDAFADCR